MIEPTLERQAHAAWLLFAQPVLAAGGDYELEKAAYGRPGVAEARATYDRVSAELDREARRTRGEAMLLQRQLVGEVDEGLR